MSWIQTYSGKKFFLFEPRFEMVNRHDIVHALSNLCRFGGHCRRFYSVLEHSVRCYEVSRRLEYGSRLQKLCLLHDAHEAYTGDMVRPLKGKLPEYRDVCESVQKAVLRLFDLKCPTHVERNLIESVDTLMLAAEVEHVMGADPERWGFPRFEVTWDDRLEEDWKQRFLEGLKMSDPRGS